MSTSIDRQVEKVKITNSEVCNNLTRRIARLVGRALGLKLNVANEVKETEVEHVIEFTYSQDSSQDRIRILKVPFITSCQNVTVLPALLYAHYLLGRVWIIHKTHLPKNALIDQLNATIREKYAAIHDPFESQKTSVADLSKYALPSLYNFEVDENNDDDYSDEVFHDEPQNTSTLNYPQRQNPTPPVHDDEVIPEVIAGTSAGSTLASTPASSTPASSTSASTPAGTSAGSTSAAGTIRMQNLRTNAS